MVVVGLNHKTAPISLLERFSISEEQLPKALSQLSNCEHVLEGAILSTCNRVEVYAVVSKFHAGAQDLRNFLAEFCHVAPEDFTDHLYTYHEDAAARHLFRVAAGIDSMVIGESEILGQVRRALQAALDESSTGRILTSMFRRASRAGRRARTETAIGRNPVSVSSAAVELARRAFGAPGLTGKRVLIVGAGKMGRLAAQALVKAGTGQVTIVNRTEEKARDLAAITDATSRSFEELPDALVETDIALCSTTSPQTVLDRTLLEEVVSRRPQDSELLIVDIAVPRDVDPEARDISGITLRDLEDLKVVVELGRGSRQGEVTKVEEIVTEEVQRFVEWQNASEVAPAVASLLERAETIRKEEFDRVQRRLHQLNEDERHIVEQLTRRLVAKLMHRPIERARDLNASQAHVYLTALRELLELDDDQES